MIIHGLDWEGQGQEFISARGLDKNISCLSRSFKRSKYMSQILILSMSRLKDWRDRKIGTL